MGISLKNWGKGMANVLTLGAAYPAGKCGGKKGAEDWNKLMGRIGRYQAEKDALKKRAEDAAVREVRHDLTALERANKAVDETQDERLEYLGRRIDRAAQQETIEQLAGAKFVGKLEASLRARGVHKDVVAVLQQAIQDRRISLDEVAEIATVGLGFAIATADSVTDDIRTIFVRLTELRNTVSEQAARFDDGLQRLLANVLDLAAELTGYGNLPSGSWKQDLENGSLFIGGRRFDALSFAMNLILIKGMRVYPTLHESELEEQDLVESIFPRKKKAAPVLSRRRIAKPEDQDVREADDFAAFPVEGNLQFVYKDELRSMLDLDRWPIGATVFVAPPSLHLALDAGAIGRVVVGGGILTNFNKWYVNLLLPALSETVARFAGVEPGTDFARALKELSSQK